MLKLILKSLWARRRRNVWIILELILITIVAWVVLDPAIVTGYNLSLQPGYDIDRLVSISLSEIPEKGRGYKAENAEKFMDDVRRLLDKVRTYNEVENATIVTNTSFEQGSMNVSSFPADSTDGCYVVVKFFRNTDFFKTFGIKDLDGNNFVEPPLSGNDIIISKSVARIMHPGINPVGHYLNESSNTASHRYEWDRNKLIAGVTDDAIYRSTMGRSPIVYKYEKDSKIRSANSVSLALRLKPGVNPDRFIVEYSEMISKSLRSGNIYAHSPISYTDIKDNMSRIERNKYIISLALVSFFFINLCLGIIGTFYLQTRTRSRDTGIMRSFGATPGSILREIISEGWIMTTLSCVIGCGLYYLYIRKEGLFEPDSMWGHSDTIITAMPHWHDSFWMHFGIISAIIYVALMITVSIGIYFPAWRISHANPVDALKDE